MDAWDTLKGEAAGNMHLGDVVCCFLHSELSKLLYLIFTFLCSTSSASMAGHSDSDRKNSNSNEAEFKEESKILLGLSNGGAKFVVMGRAPLCVLFATARKCPHGVFVSFYST
jgi:hypothetical protein